MGQGQQLDKPRLQQLRQPHCCARKPMPVRARLVWIVTATAVAPQVAALLPVQALHAQLRRHLPPDLPRPLRSWRNLLLQP